MMKNTTCQQNTEIKVTAKMRSGKMLHVAIATAPLLFLLHALPAHAANPVIAVPTNASYASGSDTIFSVANGNAITVTDPDSAGNAFIVTISVPAADGMLALGSTSNLTTFRGNNTSTLVMRGSISALQEALDGLTLSVSDDCICDTSFALDINIVRITEAGFINSGIELPVIENVSFAQVIESEVPGWTTDASDDLIEIWTSGFRGVVSHSGVQHMEVNATEVANLTQTFTPPTAGVPLAFSFAHRGRDATDTMNVTITDMGADSMLGGGDDLILLDQDYSTDPTAWVVYTGNAGSSSGNPVEVSFDSSPFGGGSSGNFIDSILIFDASEFADSSVSLIEDSDGDGIPDSVENANPSLDTDNDDLINSLDTDSDGDGISDALEAGADPASPVDTDEDGDPDYIDLDSDNDGIPDSVEAGSDPANPSDSDTDGDLDFREEDSDGDGISDTDEAGSDPSNPADDNENGIPDFQESPGSSEPESPEPESPEPETPADNDSDNDGIPDDVEGTDDTDDDGIANNLDIDSDNDGLLDSDEAGDADEPADSDGDGIDDYLDLDSDNDALTDTFEAGGVDDDGDGLVDEFIDDNGDGHDDSIGLQPLPADNFDGDNFPDWRDVDSDNDGLSDVFESLGADSDTDGDGRIDNIIDADADGLVDDIDVNSTLDTDGDEAFNHLDLDSDNDTLTDLAEVGGADTDGDGQVDGWADEDGDGIPDSVDVDQVAGAEDDDDDGIINDADADFTGQIDTDGDDIIDLFDDDPNGSGFIMISDTPLTEDALPDANNNDIPDVFEPDPDAQTGDGASEDGVIRTGLEGVGCSVGEPGQTKDPLLASLAMLSSAWLLLGYFTRRRISLTVRSVKGE